MPSNTRTCAQVGPSHDEKPNFLHLVCPDDVDDDDEDDRDDEDDDDDEDDEQDDRDDDVECDNEDDDQDLCATCALSHGDDSYGHMLHCWCVVGRSVGEAWTHRATATRSPGMPCTLHHQARGTWKTLLRGRRARL
jgi:hypothetical protein